MIVTFPHLGPLSIVVGQFFKYLDVKYVIPPENGERALSEGSSISPEEICLPFKYMAGNFVEAHKLGADTAIMVATNGPCRLGEYGQLLKDVLDDSGHGFEWILLDTPSAIGAGELIKRVKQFTCSGGAGWSRIMNGMFLSLKLVHKIDGLRKSIQWKAGYLKEPYEAVKLLNKTERMLEDAESFNMCFSIIKSAKKELASFASDRSLDPVKVLIAGEIYTSIEAEANGRLEEKLMVMGCSVKRHIDISWWIRYTFINTFIPDGLMVKLTGGGAIKANVGGYGRETVNRIMKDSWCDGIIKIMPAGCMPEIVTKAYCQAVQDEKNLRILHLIYDEMGGRAGYETRVEAFIDMLERRKNVLAGNRYRIHKHRSDIDG